MADVQGDALPLIRGGAVVARQSADTDPAIQADYPNLAPMVEAWRTAAVPDWRPQIECYPRFSDIVSDWGSRIELGQVEIKQGLDSMAKDLSATMQSSGCWGKSSDAERAMKMYQ